MAYDVRTETELRDKEISKKIDRLEVLECKYGELLNEYTKSNNLLIKYSKLEKVIEILKNKKITTGLIDGYYNCYDDYIENLEIEYDLDKKYLPTKEEFDLLKEVLQNE